MKKLVVAAALCAAILPRMAGARDLLECSLANPGEELVVNGSFEQDTWINPNNAKPTTGDLGNANSARTVGWTNGTIIAYGEYTPPYDFFHGHYACNVRPKNRVVQTIDVPSDGIYTLSFRYAHRKSYNENQPIDLAVLFDDETNVFFRVDATTVNGVDYSTDVTLSAGTRTLCFTGVAVPDKDTDTLYHLDNVSLKFKSFASEGIDRTLEVVGAPGDYGTPGRGYGLYHGFAEGERVTATLPSGAAIATGWVASVSNETTDVWEPVASGAGNVCDFTYTGAKMKLVWTVHRRAERGGNLFVNGDFEQSSIGYYVVGGFLKSAFSPNNGKTGIVPGWTGSTVSTKGGDYAPDDSFFSSGKYVMFVQMNSKLSQTVDVPMDGYYFLSCKYAHRSYGRENKHYLTISFDGTPIADEMETPQDTTAKVLSFKNIKLTAGRHVFKIQGRVENNADASTCFDDFQLYYLKSDPADVTGGTLEVRSPAAIRMVEASGLYEGFANDDQVSLALPTATVTDEAGNVWVCTGWTVSASNETTGAWASFASGAGTTAAFAHTGGAMRFDWLWHPQQGSVVELVADGGFEEALILNAKNFGNKAENSLVCDSWDDVTVVKPRTNGDYRDITSFGSLGGQYGVLRPVSSGVLGCVSQTVNVPVAGVYTLKFRYMHRPDWNPKLTFFLEVKIGETIAVPKFQVPNYTGAEGTKNLTWEGDVTLEKGMQILAFHMAEGSDVNDNACFLDDISLKLKESSGGTLTIVGRPENLGTVDPAYGTYLGFATNEVLGATASAERLEDGNRVSGWKYGSSSGSGTVFSGLHSGNADTLTWRWGKGGFAIILK